MPRTEKPIQPGPSRNAVDLPGSARTDHEVAPSTVKTPSLWANPLNGEPT